MLDTKTGHMKNMTILSVYIPKQTLDTLNFDNIDPSDSMKNFVHKMDFKKGKVLNLWQALSTSEYSE